MINNIREHSVEKIGGTSMNDYVAIRDNIIKKPVRSDTLYQRVFVVSAYGGITDGLLEHKKTGETGVYTLFADSVDNDSWKLALDTVKNDMFEINRHLFANGKSGADGLLDQANQFLNERIEEARRVLVSIQNLCQHGHFSLSGQLATVREMLSSIGEAHSARNTAMLLNRDGINACFVDLTGWQADEHIPLDQRIETSFNDIDLNKQMPIVTGYAHSKSGLMSSFDRGYSEMTFSRIAVLTKAKETVIHKEFHLSSADPQLVGAINAVPIGRTNYDVADQLANLGVEAIHPKAAKGLRYNNIPLRVKNTFEPDHAGTLITGDYVSETPCVEIIAGCKGVFSLALFDQNMTGNIAKYDSAFLSLISRFKAYIISKDVNANTITNYLHTNLKTMKRIRALLEEDFPEAEIDQQKVAIVSAIGSDMQVPGLLAKAVNALAEQDISVLAMHQTMRQVDMQFIVEENDFDCAIQSLHRYLVEAHDHGRAIKLAT